MEYPNVSILMPTYNRPNFLPLITYNLLNMNYDKTKLELCILDDGKEPLFTTESLKETKNTLSPLKINYIQEKTKNTINFRFNLIINDLKNFTNLIS